MIIFFWFLIALLFTSIAVIAGSWWLSNRPDAKKDDQGGLVGVFLGLYLIVADVVGWMLYFFIFCFSHLAKFVGLS